MRFRNILWNLVGLSLPLLIAALTVPRLLALIGTERFGFLALAWGLIGYSGALDLGIGRATTQRVSALRGGTDANQIPNVVATAIRITLLTGSIGMLVILLASLGGIYRYIQVVTVSASEIEVAMMMVALALPMQAISATYRGVNEAYLNFGKISILRIVLGVANFGGPFLVALYTNQLHWLVATLVISRALALVFFRHFAYSCIRKAGYPAYGKYNKKLARNLLHFGGWFTISSIVSPLLVQADRFFVGALISASAVTLYVIPYEVTVQSLILVGAVTTVAFPVISNLINNSPQQAVAIFRLWLLRVAGLMFVVMSALAYVMPDLLRLWIGSQASPESILVGQILCLGVFMNAIGAMYFSLLHAQSHVRVTALLHLVELPGFIGMLYLFVTNYGVTGAAIAWVCRVTFDTMALALIVKSVKLKSGLNTDSCKLGVAKA